MEGPKIGVRPVTIHILVGFSFSKGKHIFHPAIGGPSILRGEATEDLAMVTETLPTPPVPTLWGARFREELSTNMGMPLGM